MNIQKNIKVGGNYYFLLTKDVAIINCTVKKVENNWIYLEDLRIYGLDVSLPGRDNCRHFEPALQPVHNMVINLDNIIAFTDYGKYPKPKSVEEFKKEMAELGKKS